ncbi:MAG: hypothetical protein ACJ76N_06120 [Thermoanaerobaculia bacterium]
MNELSTTRIIVLSWLILPLLLVGCKESPQWAKAGPFYAVEKAPPGKAVVYVYWLRKKPGRISQISVLPCKEFERQAVLPGGYTSFVVDPGPSCFQAEVSWDLPLEGASAIEDLGKAQISNEPGERFFFRIAQDEGPFLSHFGLQPVKPEIADSEIRRCRRSIPLSFEEIASRER